MLGQSYDLSQVPGLPGNPSSHRTQPLLTLCQTPSYMNSTNHLVWATFCRVYYFPNSQIRKLRSAVVKWALEATGFSMDLILSLRKLTGSSGTEEELAPHRQNWSSVELKFIQARGMVYDFMFAKVLGYLWRTAFLKTNFNAQQPNSSVFDLSS